MTTSLLSNARSNSNSVLLTRRRALSALKLKYVNGFSGGSFNPVSQAFRSERSFSMTLHAPDSRPVEI
jgi:hypothetical protein